jgi:hypothetical protein
MINKRKQQLLFIFGGLIFIIYAIYASNKTDSVNINNPEYTICELVPEKEGYTIVMFDAKFEYYVSDKKYNIEKTPLKYKYNVIGEKFVLRYDKDNPEEAEIVSYKPLFLKEEKTNYVKGNILRLYNKFNLIGSSKYAIDCEYIINGTTFIKSQDLPPNYKDIYPQLKEGDKYIVEYWLQNPKRAIIHLDKPAI